MDNLRVPSTAIGDTIPTLDLIQTVERLTLPTLDLSKEKKKKRKLITLSLLPNRVP